MVKSTSEPLIGKLVICGVGLIGGSFALGLRRAAAVAHVVGIGRRREPLERARALGVIDEIATDWALALTDADLVLLAAPVGQMDTIMAAMAPHLGPHTIVTDAGSTKRDVVAAIHRHLARHLAQVVPAHPIAGAEKSGVEAAFAELYSGRKVVLTPLAQSRPEAVERVRAAWQACGATVVDMTPQEHDRVFAAVSHLPHLLAFGLVDELARRDNASVLFFINQIIVKKKAKDKLPTWFSNENIIYPEKISIEQTSSETTAKYKASLVSGEKLIDCTGGFGIDDYYFSIQFKTVIHCELNEGLSQIVQHNFEVLKASNIECYQGDSTEILEQLNQKFDCIYIDPSRRNEAKGKVFMLAG